jgi:hypothetical protein
MGVRRPPPLPPPPPPPPPPRYHGTGWFRTVRRMAALMEQEADEEACME